MTRATSPAGRHGNLARALLDAGTALARDGGPEAVGLREATRRVGVSPTAVYRHYADHHALLRAVGAGAMAELARAMEAEQARAVAADPSQEARARLRGVGAGYLGFARRQPGLFRTAFATVDEVGDDAGARGRSGLTPLELLTAALDHLVDAGQLAPHRRPGAELVAWSAVHGLAQLLHGPLRTLEEAQVHRLVEQVLDTVESGLLSPEEPRTRRTP